jgi:transglutaminase-like putative cysteine protease
MRLHLGCRLDFDLPQPTPMIALLNVHADRLGDLERPDRLWTSPFTPAEQYHDAFGNHLQRFTAPAGAFSVGADGVIRDDGAPDPIVPDAPQHAVEALPSETLQFLLGSRYCETDRLSETAWSLFGATPLGWPRVQAVCDWVHAHVTFDYMSARADRTAAETLAEGRGVCRDFTHLAVTFCRALNIPTRYCTGYVSDIGVPPPHPPMDFAAWMEVYLGGAWRTFDPRNNDVRRGRVLVGRGRDAADVPLTHGFGPHVLTGFEVWIREA